VLFLIETYSRQIKEITMSTGNSFLPSSALLATRWRLCEKWAKFILFRSSGWVHRDCWKRFQQ